MNWQTAISNICIFYFPRQCEKKIIHYFGSVFLLLITDVNPGSWVFRISLAKESTFCQNIKWTAMITFSVSPYHGRLANSTITFQNEEINLFPDNWNLFAWDKKIIAFEGRFHSTWCFKAFALFCLNHIFIKSKRIVWSLIIIKLKSDKKSIRIPMFHDNIFREEKGVKSAY